VLDKPLALADAQLVVAREYGFRNWGDLKHRIEQAQQIERIESHPGFDAALDALDDGDVDRLRALACSGSVGRSRTTKRAGKSRQPLQKVRPEHVASNGFTALAWLTCGARTPRPEQHGGKRTTELRRSQHPTERKPSRRVIELVQTLRGSTRVRRPANGERSRPTPTRQLQPVDGVGAT
jgi:hypothetical protein